MASLANNQVELNRNQVNTDEQLAVLIRMTVMQLNALTESVRVLASAQQTEGQVTRPDGTEVPWQSVVPDPVTFVGINGMFDQWKEFRSRPDFRDHFRTWYMGHDLAELPPAPSAPEALGQDLEGAGGQDGGSEQQAVTEEEIPAPDTEDAMS